MLIPKLAFAMLLIVLLETADSKPRCFDVVWARDAYQINKAPGNISQLIYLLLERRNDSGTYTRKLYIDDVGRLA